MSPSLQLHLNAARYVQEFQPRYSFLISFPFHIVHPSHQWLNLQKMNCIYQFWPRLQKSVLQVLLWGYNQRGQSIVLGNVILDQKLNYRNEKSQGFTRPSSGSSHQIMPFQGYRNCLFWISVNEMNADSLSPLRVFCVIGRSLNCCIASSSTLGS